MGIMVCHTTSILNCCLCEIVQWIKPPFLLFPKYLSTFPFSSGVWVGSFWIKYIITLALLFVNTIFIFYFNYFIIVLFVYNFQTF